MHASSSSLPPSSRLTFFLQRQKIRPISKLHLELILHLFLHLLFHRMSSVGSRSTRGGLVLLVRLRLIALRRRRRLIVMLLLGSLQERWSRKRVFGLLGRGDVAVGSDSSEGRTRRSSRRKGTEGWLGLRLRSSRERGRGVHLCLIVC